jgi:hypothetical protein
MAGERRRSKRPPTENHGSRRSVAIACREEALRLAAPIERDCERTIAHASSRTRRPTTRRPGQCTLVRGHSGHNVVSDVDAQNLFTGGPPCSRLGLVPMATVAGAADRAVRRGQASDCRCMDWSMAKH